MKIKNLETINGKWWFQFGTSKNNGDFNRALKLIKKVPLEDRAYHQSLGDRKHVWEIKVDDYDGLLARAFTNFEEYKKTIENQRKLFNI